MRVNTGTHWGAVDDISPDYNATYIYSTNYTVHGDHFKFPDTSGVGRINKIAVCFLATRQTQGSSDGYVAGQVRIGATDYSLNGILRPPLGSWELYSCELTTNPATAQPWTWAEMDVLEVRQMLRAYDGQMRCTQVYVEIDYSPPIVVSTTVHLKWNVLAFVASTVHLKWNVLALVASTVHLKWNVLALVASTVHLKWNVLAFVASTVHLKWNVLALVASTILCQWRVRALVNQSRLNRRRYTGPAKPKQVPRRPV